MNLTIHKTNKIVKIILITKFVNSFDDVSVNFVLHCMLHFALRCTLHFALPYTLHYTRVNVALDKRE